jgi:hypothetical protein
MKNHPVVTLDGEIFAHTAKLLLLKKLYPVLDKGMKETRKEIQKLIKEEEDRVYEMKGWRGDP